MSKKPIPPRAGKKNAPGKSRPVAENSAANPKPPSPAAAPAKVTPVVKTTPAAPPAPGKVPAGAPAGPPQKQPADKPKIELIASRQFASWLDGIKASLAFSTYQAGKVFLIGMQPNGQPSIFERTFNRCMGMCATGDGFIMSSLYQLWRFENVLDAGGDFNGFDRAYVPIIGHTTGDLDIHDMAVDNKGRIVFVNTLFSCLATVGGRTSFVPLWRPPFITKLAAEDRCHLNGLAMDQGKPAYVTVIAPTDVANGWHDKRASGGCVIDVRSNEIVARGLSMPHSPRLYRGKLWILNSGTGEFGTIDPANGKFQPIAFCPGYLRGLSFVGDYALAGLSKPRQNHSFAGLPLDETLKKKNVAPQCGIFVIDLRTGDIVHWLRLEGIVEELYDVIVLPGVRRPMAFGFKTDEIRRVVKMGVMPEGAPW